MAVFALTRALKQLAGASPKAPTPVRTSAAADLLTLIRQGVVRPIRPDKLLRIFLAWRRWGITPALGYAVGAIRHPDRPAVIDERGALSFAEVSQRTTRLAHGLRKHGIHSGSRVGILCRNHHGPVETMIACAKLGADIVLLNTGLNSSQLTEVIEQQRIDLLLLDSEFTEHLGSLPDDLPTVLAWTEGTTQRATLEHLIGHSPDTAMGGPKRHSKVIVLTSGTTGAPKGVARPDPSSLSPAATIMSRVPLRDGERVLLCAPLFHAWGIAAFQLSAVLGATLVLRRKYEPQQSLASLQRHRCSSMFAVPIMLQRLLDLPGETQASYDTSSLRIVASSGSALPAELATRFQQKFGPILYNFYGSTEVSWASIATPRDLQQAPGTAGRPPRGTTIRILDENGMPVRRGATGRIFVGNDMLFDGYTNGQDKERSQGLIATGDLGYIDENGRLFIAGREDDMIVSGGENIYPKETEEAIASLPGVADVAVIGVEDAEFGQRLVAFVVVRPESDLDSASIREQIRPWLPKFALPRDVVFLDELPRNATDKVIPRELRAQVKDSP